MIFLWIAIGWIVLLVLFVIVWGRFAGRRRSLSEQIEQDRVRSRALRTAEDPDHKGDGTSGNPPDAA